MSDERAERLKVLLNRMIVMLDNPTTALRDIEGCEKTTSALIDELQLRDAGSPDLAHPVFGREYRYDDDEMPTDCKRWHTSADGHYHISFHPAAEAMMGLALSDPMDMQILVQDYRSAVNSWLHKLEDAIGKEPKAAGDYTHNDDFTSVIWRGTRYTFAKGQQAQVIKALWKAGEKGGHGLALHTIREKVESSNNRFRVVHVFRNSKTGKIHPAYKAMIVEDGKGVYKLKW